MYTIRSVFWRRDMWVVGAACNAACGKGLRRFDEISVLRDMHAVHADQAFHALMLDFLLCCRWGVAVQSSCLWQAADYGGLWGKRVRKRVSVKMHMHSGDRFS